MRTYWTMTRQVSDSQPDTCELERCVQADHWRVYIQKSTVGCAAEDKSCPAHLQMHCCWQSRRDSKKKHTEKQTSGGTHSEKCKKTMWCVCHPVFEFFQILVEEELWRANARLCACSNKNRNAVCLTLACLLQRRLTRNMAQCEPTKSCSAA